MATYSIDPQGYGGNFAQQVVAGYAGKIGQMPRTVEVGYDREYLNTSGFQTLINWSSTAGVLLVVNNDDAGSLGCYVKVTVDGTVMTGWLDGTHSFGAGERIVGFDEWAYGLHYAGPIFFRSSLKVEAKRVTSPLYVVAGAMKLNWG